MVLPGSALGRINPNVVNRVPAINKLTPTTACFNSVIIVLVNDLVQPACAHGQRPTRHFSRKKKSERDRYCARKDQGVSLISIYIMRP